MNTLTRALLLTTAAGLFMTTAALAGDGNKAGDLLHKPIVQSGPDNALSIDQSAGNNNEIGIGPAGSPDGTYFTQSAATASTTPGSDSNSATIKQKSNGNKLEYFVQDASGVYSDVANLFTLTQKGGDDNVVDIVYQNQAGAAPNSADITENGANNWIEYVDQQSALGTATNSMTISITGSGNGYDGAGSYGSLGFLSGASGASASKFRQVQVTPATDLTDPFAAIYEADGSYGNSIDFSIDHGDNNQFGITQKGNNNTVGTVVVRGDENALGIWQEGQLNTLTGGGGSGLTINGDGNDVGIYQVGDGNDADLATLDSGSNYNNVAIGQIGNDNTNHMSVTGSSNTVVSGQVGDTNEATVSIDGHDNFATTVQDNHTTPSAVGNTLTLKVTGNYNNQLVAGTALASFSGKAASAAAASITVGALVGSNLPPGFSTPGLLSDQLASPGVLAQLGDEDTLDVEVGQTDLHSNNNRFAVVQQGSGDDVLATLNGNNNQFAVVQAGSTNVANLQQAGNGNNMGIAQ